MSGSGLAAEGGMPVAVPLLLPIGGQALSEGGWADGWARARVAAPAASGAAPKPRIGWVDTARGITMFLVVLLHADIVSQQLGHYDSVVLLAGHALYALRMPLFFLVAGLLAAGLLRRSAQEVLERRVLYYAWLYALWSLLYAGFHGLLLPGLGPPTMEAYYTNVEGPAAALLVTWNNVWFLYILGLFYLLALALRRLTPAQQAATALAVMLPGLLDWGEALGAPVFDRFLHFPYFMAGLLAPQLIRGAVPRLAHPAVFAATGAAWLGAAALLHLQDLLREPVAIALLSLLAVPSGLGFAAWLTMMAPRLAAPLQAVGRDTLPIYVLHTMTLRVLMAVLPQPDWAPGFVYQPLMALWALVAAYWLGQLLQPVPGLFGLPVLRRRRALA